MSRKRKNTGKRLHKNSQARTKIEAKVAQYLDELGLDYKQNHRVDRYSVDFLVDDKYIIECYGDFWHCNPEKYGPDYYNRGLKCQAQDRWNRDFQRQYHLESSGFPMLVLWENHIKNNAKYCKLLIKKHLNGVDENREIA